MTDDVQTMHEDDDDSAPRRYPVPVKVLYDTDEEYNPIYGRCRLIDPNDAAEIIAFGGHLRRRHPALIWDNFTPGHYTEMSFAEDEGRMELARELIGDAIEDGRIRCAFVREGSPLPFPNHGMKNSILLEVPPEDLKALNPSMSWEDGPYISFGGEMDEGGFDEFLLFWDDLVSIRPVIANDFADPTGNVDMSSPIAASPQLGHSISVGVGPGDPGYSQRTRSNKGKGSKPYGKAIAKVLVRAAAYGIDAAAAQGNKVVGGWLREAYAELHVDPLPKVEDAGRDAKAAILALQEIMAGAAATIEDTV
jgi:hypothetical protein